MHLVDIYSTDGSLSICVSGSLDSIVKDMANLNIKEELTKIVVKESIDLARYVNKMDLQLAGVDCG